MICVRVLHGRFTGYVRTPSQVYNVMLTPSCAASVASHASMMTCPHFQLYDSDPGRQADVAWAHAAL